MAWIICEGIDRSGKSTVAEQYKNKGFEIHHMSAPDKKYFKTNSKEGYIYLDECLDIYMKFNGKDIFFDRSVYGEKVWPYVYSRESLLPDEDIEILREIEAQNDTRYILMTDPNVEAHWNRCVSNNEPLNIVQFNKAVKLYDNLKKKYNFTEMHLSDFLPQNKVIKKDSVGAQVVQENEEPKTVYQLKLEEANAINMILSSKIVKKRGQVYTDIENGIRSYLQDRLSNIFGSSSSNKLTDEEIVIFKKYVERLKIKMEKQ